MDDFNEINTNFWKLVISKTFPDVSEDLFNEIVAGFTKQSTNEGYKEVN